MSATTTASPTLSPTAVVLCVGDCDADGMVTVDEVLRLVRIAIGEGPIGLCAAGDVDGNGLVTIEEIVRSVNVALEGCDAAG